MVKIVNVCWLPTYLPTQYTEVGRYILKATFNFQFEKCFLILDFWAKTSNRRWERNIIYKTSLEVLLLLELLNTFKFYRWIPKLSIQLAYWYQRACVILYSDITVTSHVFDYIIRMNSFLYRNIELNFI